MQAARGGVDERVAAALLADHEPPPWRLEQAGARGCGVIVCDHASNRIPAALANLELPAEALEAHIAWDIGAGAVAAALAPALDLPLIRAGYSRLVSDCNRRPDSPACMPAISDGRLVPGNLGLDARARARRREVFYWPYHHAIAAELERRGGGARVPAVLSVHSFSPRMNGVLRDWHVGILWDRDPRIALPLLAALRREPGLRVGDNQPYSGRHPDDFTVDHHGEHAGRPYVSIEIRQDLVADAAGQQAWARRLAAALTPVLADPALYRHLNGARARGSA